MRVHSLNFHFDGAPEMEFVKSGGFSWIEITDTNGTSGMKISLHASDANRLRCAVAAFNAEMLREPDPVEEQQQAAE